MIIARDRLEEFFADTRERLRSGRAKFDIDEVCPWSFQFVDSNQELLEPLAVHLEAIGHCAVDLPSREPNPCSNPISADFFLRADRIERLTVDDRLARNSERSGLAIRFAVLTHGGVDVDEVNGP